MKYIEVRRNGSPIQGFGRDVPVIIGAKSVVVPQRTVR